MAVSEFTVLGGSPDILWSRTEHAERINGVAFSSDGSLVASGSSDRLIKLWRTSDGTLLNTFNENAPRVHESAVEAVDFSPNNEFIAWPSFQTVKMVRISDGSIRSFKAPGRNTAHVDWAINVAFSPDGSQLASVSFDGTAKVWRVSDGALLRSINPTNGQLRAVAYSPNGNLLAIAGGGPHTIKLYNTSDWSLRTVLGEGDQKHSNDIWWVAFSPDGSKLASASEDATAKIWRVSDGALLHNLDRHTGRTYALAFSADGQTLATVGTGDDTIRLWRVSDGSQIRIYDQQTTEANAIAISPSNLMVYGRTDKTLVLARLNGGNSSTPVVTLNSPNDGAAFTAPATIVMTASSSGPVVRMEFYQDNNKLGQSTTPPYTFTWNATQPGAYDLRAVGITSQGGAISSPSSRVVVNGGSSTGPSISITAPENGATFSAPAEVTIQASASAPGSTISKVEFFAEGDKVGEDTSAPYAFQWNNVPEGTHALTAVVRDSQGRTATSAPITIQVEGSGGGSDTIPPRVRIDSPAANSRVTANPLPVRGRATDETALALVRIKVGSGEFQNANGTEEWQAEVTLQPGANQITVESVDAAGNVSSAQTRTVTYVQTSELRITVEGSGRVFPNLDGRQLEVGKRYTIRALPAAGFIFANWGESASNAANATLTFTMTPGLELKPLFIPNPFNAVRGAYSGLIIAGNGSPQMAGLANFIVTGTGSFSSRLNLGGNILAFAGKFDAAGRYARTFSRRNAEPLTIELQVPLENPGAPLTGTLRSGEVTSTVTAHRSAFNSANPAPQQGRYTLVFTGSEEENAPKGDGFAIATIDRTGRVRVTGNLGDATRLSYGGTLAQDGTFPIYSALYRKQGALQGVAATDPVSADDIEGTLSWLKPASPQDRYYSEGFSTETDLVGSRYVTGSGQRLLNLEDRENNAELILGAGNLDSEIRQEVSITPNNKAVVTGPNELKSSLKLTSSSGLISGNFIHPTSGRATSYRGVVLQKQNQGAGLFLGPNQSGYVEIVPH